MPALPPPARPFPGRKCAVIWKREWPATLRIARWRGNWHAEAAPHRPGAGACRGFRSYSRPSAAPSDGMTSAAHPRNHRCFGHSGTEPVEPSPGGEWQERTRDRSSFTWLHGLVSQGARGGHRVPARDMQPARRPLPQGGSFFVRRPPPFHQDCCLVPSVDTREVRLPYPYRSLAGTPILTVISGSSRQNEFGSTLASSGSTFSLGCQRLLYGKTPQLLLWAKSGNSRHTISTSAICHKRATGLWTLIQQYSKHGNPERCRTSCRTWS